MNGSLKVNISGNHPSISLREACVLAGAFIVFRALSIAALYLVSGGRELASDVVFHEIIIADPLGILKGTAIHIASYPPFQWLFEWPLFNLFRVHFGEMVSYRLMMVSIEFATFLCTIALCMKIRPRKTIAVWLLVLFIISPHQSFASVFFIQEDVIAQLFMLIALLFLLHEKRGYCIATLVCGVLIAKLFFVVPLFYVGLFYGQRLFRQRVVDGILALLPLVMVYIFIITQALNNGGEVPIRDFTPPAIYAGNYWVLLINANPELLEFYKNISLVLTTFVQLLVIASLLYFNRNRQQPWHPIVLLVIPLAFFFGTFFQHMPEYLLMIWPIAALLCTSIWQQWLLAAAMSFAWVPRITHGLTTVVRNFGSSAEARSDIVGPLVNFFNIDYDLLNHVVLVVQSVVYTAVVVWLCVLCLRLQQRYNNPS